MKDEKIVHTCQTPTKQMGVGMNKMTFKCSRRTHGTIPQMRGMYGLFTHMKEKNGHIQGETCMVNIPYMEASGGYV